MFEKIRRNLPRTQPNPTPSVVLTTNISNPRLLEVNVDNSTSPTSISGVFGIDITNTGLLNTRSLRITNAKIDLMKNAQTLNIGKIEEIKKIKNIPSGQTRTLRIKFDRKNNFIDKIDKDLCNAKEVKTNITLTVAEIILAATYSNKEKISVENTDCNLVTVNIQGQQNVNVNQEYTWKLVASDGSTLNNVDWDMGDGTTKSGSEVTHQYQREGVFDVRAESGSNSDRLTVNAERLPLAIVGPTSVEVGESNTWEPSGNNLQNLSGFSWTMGDGTVIEGQQAQHVYESEGEYNLSLTTNEGTSTSITVESSFPNVTVSGINGRNEVVVDSTHNWRLIGSNFGEADEIQWNMGDGTTKTGQEISHKYTSRSEYTMTASAKVEGRTIDSTEISVNVTSPDILLSTINGRGNIETGTQYQWTAQGSNLNQADEIKWDMGDGTTKTGITVTHTYTQSLDTTITARARFEGETVSQAEMPIIVSAFRV